MILNKKSKEELKSKIIEKLIQVPEGKKVKIPKDILEDLLFETIILNKETKHVIKLPIWSGNFLQRVDLSEVNFDNVSWSIFGVDKLSDLIDEADIDYSTDINLKELERKIKGIKDNRKLSSFPIVFEGTNASIDLTRSYEAKQDQYIDIRSCRFRGIDLSTNDLSEIEEIYIMDSDIGDTNLRIPKKTHVFASNSILNGIDLSSRKIPASSYFVKNRNEFYNCSLRNTHIQIIFDVERHGDMDPVIHNYLQSGLKNDWVGCYVNGKIVLSKKEKEQIAEEMLKLYESFDKDITEQVLGSIDRQIKQFQKKK